jgi:hypothetical protein
MHVSRSSDPENPIEQRDMEELTEVTVGVMTKLRDAIDSRAFKRYRAPSTPKLKRELKEMGMMRDIVLYFHPAFRTLWHVDMMVKDVFGGTRGTLILPARFGRASSSIIRPNGNRPPITPK